MAQTDGDAVNSDYQSALAGTLYSPAVKGNPPPTAAPECFLGNNLPIPLNMYYLDAQGYRVFLKTIPAKSKSVTIKNAKINDWLLFTVPGSGAFVRVLRISPNQTKYLVNFPQLTAPFDIGPIPQPTKSQYIPQDSSSILVACGTLPNGNTVTREQYWHLQGDSYSLAPGESRTISYTVTTGKQNTSSTQAQISTQVGFSGSDGWGPVSASLSSSLNASAAVYQQVTITEESTSYVSTTVQNLQGDAMLVLRWQLVDLITIFNDSNTPLAGVNVDSIVIVQSYQQGGLQESPAKPPADDMGTVPEVELS